MTRLDKIPMIFWLALGTVGACSGGRAVSARDIDDAAAVLVAVTTCERSGRVDEACVAAAASAARQVLPRLQTAPAASSGGGS